MKKAKLKVLVAVAKKAAIAEAMSRADHKASTPWEQNYRAMKKMFGKLSNAEQKNLLDEMRRYLNE